MEPNKGKKKRQKSQISEKAQNTTKIARYTALFGIESKVLCIERSVAVCNALKVLNFIIFFNSRFYLFKTLSEIKAKNHMTN